MTSTTKVEQVPLIRVFLSSPSDVADERHLARVLLGMQLPYDPHLRGKVAFTVKSWDNPAAPIPMSAKLTPQKAVDHGLPRPSECNIVVVILVVTDGDTAAG